VAAVGGAAADVVDRGGGLRDQLAEAGELLVARRRRQARAVSRRIRLRLLPTG
jgi:hypothetical protein